MEDQEVSSISMESVLTSSWNKNGEPHMLHPNWSVLSKHVDLKVSQNTNGPGGICSSMLLGPIPGNYPCLFQDCLCRLFLLVWRITIFSQNFFNLQADFGLYAYSLRPVDCDAVSYHLGQIQSNFSQGFVAQNLDSA